jgi:hypothetical protein
MRLRLRRSEEWRVLRLRVTFIAGSNAKPGAPEAGVEGESLCLFPSPARAIVVVRTRAHPVRGKDRSPPKRNDALELTFSPKYADLGIGKEVRYAGAKPPIESQP